MHGISECACYDWLATTGNLRLEIFSSDDLSPLEDERTDDLSPSEDERREWIVTPKDDA